MRKILIATALATTALAAPPAAARDGAFYLELDGGVTKVEDFDFDIGTVNNAVELENDDFGYDFGGIAGYDFGVVRVEGEVGYRGISNTDLTSTIGIPATGTTATGFALPGAFDAGGDSTVLSLMLNAMGDFGDDDGLQFFAGGGVGKAKVDLDTSIRTGGPGFVDDDDWGFAWQLLAGVRAPLSDNVDVGVKYRYFRVTNTDFTDTAGREVEGDWKSHSLLGTFAVNFGGGPEPMPEPAPAPAPSAAALPVAPAGSLRSFRDGTCPECQPGEWIVTAEATAGSGGDPCPGDFSEHAAQVAVDLTGRGAAAADHAGDLGGFGPLAPYADDGGRCRALAIHLPEGARFVGFQYEARIGGGWTPCLAGEPCPEGGGRWVANPALETEAAGTLLVGAYENRAEAADQAVRFSVFFVPPSGWSP